MPYQILQSSTFSSHDGVVVGQEFSLFKGFEFIYIYIYIYIYLYIAGELEIFHIRIVVSTMLHER